MSQFLEECKSYRRVVHECSRFAGGQYLAPDDDRAVISVVYILGLEKCLDGKSFCLEDGLDYALAFRVEKGMAVGSATKQQRQCAKHDALARTGLACDCNKAIVELDVALLDESVIFYV